MKSSLTRTAMIWLVMAVVACSDKDAATAAPPQVYVSKVVQQDVPIYLEIVGQTQGAQDVEIRARVEGFLETIDFKEGAYVHKGDLLYQIDPKPLQAALAQAKANLATNQARQDQATITVNRLVPLAKQQAVSQQELDNAKAAQYAARAQVDAGKAAVDKATLDLGYARIVSPIDGIVGTTNVKAGNLVGSGNSTLLTTVSDVNPIVFRGGISESDYLTMARKLESKKAGDKEHKMEAQLLLADGTTYPQRGTLEAIERAVDPTTGTLAMQINFANPKRLLRPGLYGRVRFVSEMRKDALLVLQRAVTELQDRFNVVVVGADNKISIREVQVGPRVGDLWVIDKGLQPGDTVVVEGLQRLQNGMTVHPTPVAQPTPDKAIKAGKDEY